MNRRKGLGKGLGMGYKNLVIRDPMVHSLSARGVKTKTLDEKLGEIAVTGGLITGMKLAQDVIENKPIEEIKKNKKILEEGFSAMMSLTEIFHATSTKKRFQQWADKFGYKLRFFDVDRKSWNKGEPIFFDNNNYYPYEEFRQTGYGAYHIGSVISKLKEQGRDLIIVDSSRNRRFVFATKKSLDAKGLVWQRKIPKLQRLTKKGEPVGYNPLEDEFYFHRIDLDAKTKKDIIVHPIQTAIIIPSTGEQGKLVSGKTFLKRADKVRKDLANMFGGYTSVRGVGGWVNDKGNLVKEPAFVIESYAKIQDFDKQKIFDYARNLRKKWNQEEMGVIIENDFFRII